MGVQSVAAQAVAPLVEAVTPGDLQATVQLDSHGADVRAVDADGTTALHWAVRANDADLIQQLLAAGADVNAANRYGVTPLQVAAVNGDSAVVGMLLEAGADANAVLPEGETILMTAARTGSPEALRLLLQHGAAVEAREGWYGESAVMWAAAENHGEAIRVLVEFGADVNARSALHAFERRRSGQSILPLGSWTPLMYAARENAVDAGQALIEAGADLDLADPDGATALVIAIINAQYEFAALLLAAGADPNLADTEAGMGPLYAAADMHRLAVGHGRPNPRRSGSVDGVDIVAMLLERGADPNARLKKVLMQRHHTAGDASLGEGATPLLRAAKSGDVAVVRLLIAAGADPFVTMPNGSTALMYAAGLGWRDGSPAAPSFDQGSEAEAIATLRLLLDLGLAVHAVNDAGDTALHVAITGRGSESIVRFLVAQGADPWLGNGREQTPVSLAESRGTPAMVAVLRAAAAGSR